MSKLVTIFGGSGFVGRYIAQRMAKAGWRVRVAVRRPNEAMFVRTYGAVGQVEPVLANIRDDASVATAVQGADVVVNCVGILSPVGKNRFDSIHAEGPARIARLSAAAGVERLVHISAIGASLTAPSKYLRSKAAGETGVLEYFPTAVILRPSIIFGTEDDFFNRFAAMPGPVVPLVGASTRFQPVYVDDVAAAAQKAATGDVQGIYELGGPEVLTLRALMQRMLTVIQRRKLILGLPRWVGRIMGFGFDVARFLSLGLFQGPITRDQARSLSVDNIADQNAPGLIELGVQPTGLDAILPSYLWPYRPSGQYADMTNAAKNLRS
jgi:uncharacterized protein YbjT (DUF2867 family)